MQPAAADIVAVCCSDLHLSEKPPLVRSAEPDWFAAMGRQVKQLKDLANQYKAEIICAGDIFDKPSPSPNLINWAIQNLPVMYAIPGQHDLLHHSYQDLHKTAYQTLIEAHTIWDIRPDKPIETGRMRLHGFPWGFPPKPWKSPHGLALEVAVIHRYVFDHSTGYPDAPKEQRLGALWNDIEGYDSIIVGDNHKGFVFTRMSKIVERWESLMNCGAFFRRKADERDYKPSVGLLHEDGRIERHYLDCSEDKFADLSEIETTNYLGMGDMSGFIEEVGKLQGAVVDFRDAVEQEMDRRKVRKAVKAIVLKALEKDGK